MIKQVIIIRKDLEMGTGKIVSQACHACLGSSEETRKHNPTLWRRWLANGAKKIVVKVYSLEELQALEQQAKKNQLPNSLVVDRGLTQLPLGTVTALGIGPAEDELIDKITGKLKLL